MSRVNPLRAVKSFVPEPGPRRVYLIATLVNVTGLGMILTAMTLYGTRVVHLSTEKTGVALTIAGLIGLLAAIPIGHLADRRGPRGVLQFSMILLAIAAFGYLFVHSFVTYMLVAILDGAALNGSVSADIALMRRVGGEDATAFRSTAQTVVNVGISLGVVCTGVAVQFNTTTSYRALFLVHGLTCLANIMVLTRMPRYEPLPGAKEGSPWAVLADKPFVAYAVLGGAMFMQYFVTALLLPVWVVYHTNAPRWSISLFVLINTVLVTLFQIRVGSKVDTLKKGGAALRRAGAIFLFSCSLMGLATGVPAWAAFLLLVMAVALHTYGELWHASATFALDFGLAPAHAQGQYQGLVGMSNGAGQAVSPVILVGLILSLGRLGFVVLGACFAMLGLLGPAVASWGERTRPAALEPTADEPAPGEVVATD